MEKERNEREAESEAEGSHVVFSETRDLEAPPSQAPEEESAGSEKSSAVWEDSEEENTNNTPDYVRSPRLPRLSPSSSTSSLYDSRPTIDQLDYQKLPGSIFDKCIIIW